MKIEQITSDETLEIRHQVLWPNKPKEFCMLNDDKNGIHYGGFVNDKLICVASIFINGENARLRKFATLKSYQGKGYGTKVINKIIEELIECEIKFFWCDARVAAEKFYTRFNMMRKGDIFFKSDIKYIVMERDLTTSIL